MRKSAAPCSLALALSLALASGPALAQGCALPGGPLPNQARSVYLLDRAALTPALQTALARALNAQNTPGRVELATFDRSLQTVEDYRWPEQRTEALAQLRALGAVGRGRWLSRSLETLLAGLRRRPESVTTLYVFTGGPDDGPAPSGLRRALSAYRGARGPYDRLYLVGLGTPLGTEWRAALAGSGFGLGLELPAGRAPDFARELPPALTELGPGETPLGRLDGPARLDDRPFAALGAQLSVTAGPQASATLQRAERLTPGSVALLCAAGAPARLLAYRPGAPARTAGSSAGGGPAGGAAASLTATSNVSGLQSEVIALNPGASGVLRRGQSVTWRFQVRGAPATIQALRTPPGSRWSLTGASLGRPIPSGGEFAVNILNDRLQGAPESPQIQFTSGQVVNLPTVRPLSGGRLSLWPWLLVLAVLAALAGLLWWRRARSAAPAAAPAFMPQALSVEGGEAVLHGEEGGRRHAPLAELLDVGSTLDAPSLDGLKLEAQGAGARLVGLPPGLRLTERGRTLAVGDALRPDLLYLLASGRSAASVAARGPSDAGPASAQTEVYAPSRVPRPPEPAASGADFGRLSQDIASLGMLGGVGGLGLPRELQLSEEGLVLRGDAGEQPQELPEGPTDLGEAFGVPALQGFQVEREAQLVWLLALPDGFHLQAAGAALDVGAALPEGPLTLDVPAWLQASAQRVRAAVGEEMDTREAGLDLSGIGSAINLDHVFGDPQEGRGDTDEGGPGRH